MKSNSIHPLNRHNSNFYSTVPDAFTKFGLANFFVSVEPVQEAFKLEIESRSHTPKITLLEIGSGATIDRWQTITKLPTNYTWHITLSDFSSHALPTSRVLPQTTHYHLKTKVIDLLQPLPDSSQKYDFVLATYTFDSIWSPTDLRIIKNNHPNFIAKTHQYSHIINTYLAKTKFAKINYPGGLISFVTEAYSKILKKSATIIIGDIATSKPTITASHEKSGQQALFKREDYRLAQLVLASQGYHVELLSLSDFIAKWHAYLPLDLSDHYLLIIQNRT